MGLCCHQADSAGGKQPRPGGRAGLCGLRWGVGSHCPSYGLTCQEGGCLPAHLPSGSLPSKSEHATGAAWLWASFGSLRFLSCLLSGPPRAGQAQLPLAPRPLSPLHPSRASVSADGLKDRLPRDCQVMWSHRSRGNEKLHLGARTRLSYTCPLMPPRTTQ